jgi:hypothetical protein
VLCLLKGLQFHITEPHQSALCIGAERYRAACAGVADAVTVYTDVIVIHSYYTVRLHGRSVSDAVTVRVVRLMRHVACHTQMYGVPYTDIAALTDSH